MTLTELVDAVNAAGHALRLLGPMPGGESGAYLVVDADGRRRVLKWRMCTDEARFADVAEMLRRLGAKGYPVPAYEVVPGIPGARYRFSSCYPVRRWTSCLPPSSPNWRR